MHAFDDLGAKRSPTRAATITRPKRADDDPRVIVCAACGHALTTLDARIEVSGRHEHTCENPAGIVFRVGCFAAVTGCEIGSNPSREWSWFPGFAWQIEHCARCRAHVGWRYVREDQSFHGLILDRVRET